MRAQNSTPGRHARTKLRMAKSFFVMTTLCSGIVPGFFLHAAPSAVQQTQSKLKQLNTQISTLQHTLSSAQDKRGLLHKELSVTEKQIGNGIRELRTLHHTINVKSTRINTLQKQVDALNKKLETQQQLLARHIRARYQMGEYQPIKWILNQDAPYKISQILTYYQYIIASRQHLIDTIDATRTHLNQSKEVLHEELVASQKLKTDLTQRQQQLEQNRNYHTALIKSLSNEIQNKERNLQEIKKNKENLARLLQTLATQSVAKANTSFPQMRKKLPYPVQTQARSLRKMNQGVTFFAEEGTAVTAVYPGKVVFSNWLKGYGLLMIIDHGQGFMTLYAHNESLFKRKGEQVQQNEHIASVGHSGGIKQNGLYFEIRLKGKAIPPLAWLS